MLNDYNYVNLQDVLMDIDYNIEDKLLTNLLFNFVVELIAMMKYGDSNGLKGFENEVFKINRHMVIPIKTNESYISNKSAENRMIFESSKFISSLEFVIIEEMTLCMTNMSNMYELCYNCCKYLKLIKNNVIPKKDMNLFNLLSSIYKKMKHHKKLEYVSFVYECHQKLNYRIFLNISEKEYEIEEKSVGSRNKLSMGNPIMSFDNYSDTHINDLDGMKNPIMSYNNYFDTHINDPDDDLESVDNMYNNLKITPKNDNKELEIMDMLENLDI